MDVTCLKEINPLQHKIMVFVDGWARTKKKPIPLQEIKSHMVKQGVKTFTTINAINVLVKKRYIRRAIGIPSNRTSFVQLRFV